MIVQEVIHLSTSHLTWTSPHGECYQGCVSLPILPYYYVCQKNIFDVPIHTLGCKMQYAKNTRMFYCIQSHFVVCKPKLFSGYSDPPFPHSKRHWLNHRRYQSQSFGCHPMVLYLQLNLFSTNHFRGRMLWQSSMFQVYGHSMQQYTLCKGSCSTH